MKKLIVFALFLISIIYTLNIIENTIFVGSNPNLKSLITMPNAQAEEGCMWVLIYRDGRFYCYLGGSECCPGS